MRIRDGPRKIRQEERDLKSARRLVAALCIASLATCASDRDVASREGNHRAILLVSLEDGSVVQQMIDSEADICFKSVSSSATTCFHQGAPIIDDETKTVVGFEMREEQIELIAGSAR